MSMAGPPVDRPVEGISRVSDDNTRPQFQPPAFQPPSVPQPSGPAFGAPSVEPTAVMVEQRASRGKRPTGKIIAAAVAAVAVIAAGVFAITRISGNDKKGGAASSTELGQQFTAALNDEDILGVVDLLLPGERDTFRQPLLDMVANLKRLDVLDSSADPAKVSGLDIDLADVKVAPETPVAKDIDTIRITATNRSSIDGATLPLGDLLVQQAFGGSQPDQASEASGDDVDWKITTVEKDGRWYASLFYSIAEQARQDSDDTKPVPSSPIALAGTDQPEEAVDQMAKAIIALDVETIIGGLNPNEFEAFQRYAPIFLDQANSTADGLGVKAALTGTKYGVTGSGSHRSVTIQAFTFTESSSDQQATVALKDGCLTVDSGDTQFDSCADGGDVDKSLTQLGVGDNPDVKAFVTSVTDAFADFNGTGIAVDQVGGKWYVSPIGTTTDFINAVLSSLDKSEITDIIDKVKTLATDVSNGDISVNLPGIGTDRKSTSTTAPPNTTGPDDTIPEDTIPEDTVPDFSIPDFSIPDFTIPDLSISPARFRADTEDYIESQDVADQVGTQFSSASCETPASTDVGTTYTCTADDPDGASYVFSVRINSSASFLIEDVQPA
ncbi:MAG: proline-rich proteoglycan 2 [Ilumatobacteraceae bacterium]|nr:proline-rich proteoglycan 2 [Ilumatobacteraceae bacterium]